MKKNNICVIADYKYGGGARAVIVKLIFKKLMCDGRLTGGMKKDAGFYCGHFKIFYTIFVHMFFVLKLFFKIFLHSHFLLFSRLYFFQFLF